MSYDFSAIAEPPSLFSFLQRGRWSRMDARVPSLRLISAWEDALHLCAPPRYRNNFNYSRDRRLVEVNTASIRQSACVRLAMAKRKTPRV